VDTLAITRAYREKQMTHGLTAEGLGWTGGSRSQWRRFEVLASLLPHVGQVLDVGCGFGDFTPHVPPERYQGIDVVPESIIEARRRHPEHRFEQADVRRMGGAADYVIASGVFGLGWDDETFEACWMMCGRAFAFNALSLWAGDGGARVDPLEVVAKARLHTQKVRLYHDYLPHDFTIAMYR
jgi:hypothetical protein